MVNRFEWSVAMRYLRARRQEGFISVIAWFSLIGIALGVATLIIVMSVMNGFRHELINRIVGFNGHVTVYGKEGPVTDFDEVVKSLGAMRGVSAATPIVYGQVMATANGVSAGAKVRGVRKQDLEARRSFRLRLGELRDFELDEQLVIGYRLAQRLRVKVGDELTLVAPTFQATIFGSVPRTSTYTIGAIFDVGMPEIDSALIFMPFATAQVFFLVPNAASGVEVMLEQPEQVEAFRKPLQDRVGPTTGCSTGRKRTQRS